MPVVSNPDFDSQVQLLITTQDVDNYKHIKRDLDLLRTMVEKSELWVIKKSSSGKDDGKKDKKDKKDKDKKEKKEPKEVIMQLHVSVCCMKMW